ncbi:DUF2079 domain-containing protein [candidate division FCPU426 bacterium]|nr:DUF2079 domain-containing protein [candidate division FCPU426 bacterium]
MIFLLKALVWGGLLYLGYILEKKEIKVAMPKKEMLLIFLAAVYFLLYFYCNATRHASLGTFAINTTVYLQALSHWGLFSPILGKSLLQYHFSPILYLFVPVVTWLPYATTLFVLQALMLAAACIPCYYLARRLGMEEEAALLLALVYLNHSFTRRMAFGDFYVENLIPLALFTVLCLFFMKKDWKFWTALLLSLTIKEDVGFYIFCWALLIGIFKTEQRTPALVTAALSFAAGIFSLMFLLPANKGVYPYLNYWSQFGSGIFGIVGGAVLKPVTSLAVFFNSVFIQTIVSLAFLPFLTFWGLVLCAPAWIQLSSQHASQAGLKMYYAAPVIPFLFAAAAAGWSAFRDRWLQDSRLKFLILWGLGAYLLVFNFSWIAPRTVTTAHKTAKKIVQTIPARGQVLAQANMAPHISRPARIRVLGVNSYRQLPHFVVFNIKANIWPFSRANYLRILKKMHKDPRYEAWKEDAGVIVFKRKPGIKPVPAGSGKMKKKNAPSKKRLKTPAKKAKSGARSARNAAIKQDALRKKTKSTRPRPAPTPSESTSKQPAP